MDAEERRLLADCQAGSREAFRLLVERYQSRVCGIAYGMLNNADAARDIAQEAFLRVHKSIHRFDLNRAFYTWLYQIVVNLCIDRLRRESPQRAASLDDIGDVRDPHRTPHERATARETQEHVREALTHLPEKYRSVLVLRDLQGFSCEEIAHMTGCNGATVRWRLHIARKMFKQVWHGEKPTVASAGESESNDDSVWTPAPETP
ncbi:MAG: sigma-70 family RNA polymerase sigma factor [Planctomycetes bacterium]|nr:sigma-70 family RNA polymerase sigma factor [Planctomycetota bacterium]